MITCHSKDLIISQKELVCFSFLSQARGLMFRKKQNILMVFNEERKISLHNFFVFFPLKVVLLNTEREVVEIKNDFWPFTFWNSKEKGKYLLELALPTPVELKVGDKLNIL